MDWLTVVASTEIWPLDRTHWVNQDIGQHTKAFVTATDHEPHEGGENINERRAPAVVSTHHTKPNL